MAGCSSSPVARPAGRCSAPAGQGKSLVWQNTSSGTKISRPGSSQAGLYKPLHRSSIHPGTPSRAESMFSVSSSRTTAVIGSPPPTSLCGARAVHAPGPGPAPRFPMGGQARAIPGRQWLAQSKKRGQGRAIPGREGPISFGNRGQGRPAVPCGAAIFWPPWRGRRQRSPAAPATPGECG